MKPFIPTLFLLSSMLPLFSQSVADIEQFRQLNPVPAKQHSWEIAKNNSSEYEWVFSRLFLAYKSFISSQDIAACSFTPSCSVYALEAIKRQGVIVGGVNFFDRFSRCNSMSPKEYSRHPQTGLLFDPVHNWQHSLPEQQPK